MERYANTGESFVMYLKTEVDRPEMNDCNVILCV